MSFPCFLLSKSPHGLLPESSLSLIINKGLGHLSGDMHRGPGPVVSFNQQAARREEQKEPEEKTNSELEKMETKTGRQSTCLGLAQGAGKREARTVLLRLFLGA